MKNYKNKGEYSLVENMFPESLRIYLPVNAYLLRKATNKDLAFDARLYVKSQLHRSNKYVASYFYKNISNFI